MTINFSFVDGPKAVHKDNIVLMGTSVTRLHWANWKLLHCNVKQIGDDMQLIDVFLSIVYHYELT